MDIILIRGCNIMAKIAIICVGVISGDTFNTNRLVRMRLARVNAPPINTVEGQYAKALLESLILAKFINYDIVAEDAYGRAVAEVWVDKINVNDVMRTAGYREMETSSCGTNIEARIKNAQKATMSSL
jgi:endonuclease YncB( thermonuclease family)